MRQQAQAFTESLREAMPIARRQAHRTFIFLQLCLFVVTNYLNNSSFVNGWREKSPLHCNRPNTRALLGATVARPSAIS